MLPNSQEVYVVNGGVNKLLSWWQTKRMKVRLVPVVQVSFDVFTGLDVDAPRIAAPDFYFGNDRRYESYLEFPQQHVPNLLVGWRQKSRAITEIMSVGAKSKTFGDKCRIVGKMLRHDFKSPDGVPARRRLVTDD